MNISLTSWLSEATYTYIERFKPAGIERWFQRNSHCPVCRYDIRHYVRHNNSIEDTEFDEVIRELNEARTEPTPSTSSAASSTLPLRTPLASIFTNAVRSLINNELQHLPENSPFTDLIYTFDIPIDISGGRYRI